MCNVIILETANISHLVGVTSILVRLMRVIEFFLIRLQESYVCHMDRKHQLTLVRYNAACARCSFFPRSSESLNSNPEWEP